MVTAVTTSNFIKWLVVLLSMSTDHFSHAYYTPGNILLMDHLNINHQKGRHDLVKSFYVDTLGLVLDPRKQDNIDKGRKTLWTNAGITQFHLPEADNAQIFDGVVTLAYKDRTSFDEVMSRLNDPAPLLRDGQSLFAWSVAATDTDADASAAGKEPAVLVTDPWGSKFQLTVDPIAACDMRGRQPGVVAGAAVCAVSDLCVHVPQGTPLAGIRRFYEQVMRAPVLDGGATGGGRDSVSVVVSPQQTLTFRHSPSPSTTLLRQEAELERDATGRIVANTGPHISMYIADLPGTYQRAADIGAVFVNNRFKRQAFSLDDAVDQCMFRALEVVDPANVAAGPLVRLEHEVRSVVNRDGTKYKSCPFDAVP